jgi:hypothetical protein
VKAVTTRFLQGDDTVEPLVKQLISLTVWQDACGRPRNPRPEPMPVVVG